MDKRIFRISLTAALAGFLFGFDTVVISGANQPIKEVWDTNWFLGDSIFTFHGIFIMSMALWEPYWVHFLGEYPLIGWAEKKPCSGLVFFILPLPWARHSHLNLTAFPSLGLLEVSELEHPRLPLLFTFPKFPLRKPAEG